MKQLLFILLLLSPFFSSAQQHVRWPKGKKAAIILTYDDALKSQIDIAIPQLDSANLKGTFFLDTYFNEQDLSRWRAAAKKGHELANHTLYHPCAASSVKTKPEYSSENYTLNSIIREIATMNKLLYTIDNKTSRTYAYPCTETVVGGGNYLDTLRRSSLVKYARSGGDKNSIITDFKTLDNFQVPSWAAANNPTGDELTDFVKRTQTAGGLGIFMFHGVGGDYLQISAQAHRQLLKYLKDHEKEIWITTFQEVMDYVNKNLKQ
ncbi:polysaccharide deacetylase family protein [Rubrolithibacter danxiaensis]|uniref:polysaccharide deacetylase family protein n=1 Tax=Rubrolithibacter danxiaensis TaxID=3390805 RepID=UPI003BF8A73D